MKKKFLLILTVVILLVIGLLFPLKNTISFLSHNQPATWTPKLQLEYANTLLAKGLIPEAAVAFEVYLKDAVVEKKELAGVCNKLGNLYMDLNDYQKALANFYKSELLDPNSDYKQEMSQSIVKGLENLGLSQQAQYELDSRTALKPAAPVSRNIAIKIGKRQIAMEEIDALISNFPEQVKEQLSNDDAKLKFIREYAASEVLYEKAKKLGLDKNLNTRVMVEDFKKKMILQELLRNEVEKELKITPEEVFAYYQMNKDRFRTPERSKVSFLELSDLTKSNETTAKLKQGKGVRIEDWIEKGTAFLPNNLGVSKEAVENIIKLPKGAIVNPIKINDKLYMFLINEKEPEKQQSFEEAKQQVEGQYRMEKQQQIVRSLVDKAMEQQEVEILFQPKKTNELVAK